MSNIVTKLLLVSIFKNVLNDSIISKFIDILNKINSDESLDSILTSYSEFISGLYDKQLSQNFVDYIKFLIYTDENVLSRGCSDCICKNETILQTASYELSLFDSFIKCNYDYIKSFLYNKFPDKAEIINHLPVFYSNDTFVFNLDDVLNSYKKQGYGQFACYTAFLFNQDRKIIPVKNFNALSFDDLKNYDYQQTVIKNNTQAFLDGKEANNVLLYGDRGCGKSSTVKALIREFSEYNLKIIQVSKESFIHLPTLFDTLRNLPIKFIIFADDISFEENDKNFSSIKAILEGSLNDKPNNVIIYATTNRMHLVKESFSSREGNEVHYNDTIDEMVSLSDRFGIMLTFSLLNKFEYLEIVSKIANDCCIEVNDALFKKAEEFAALKSIRTPRVARQFIVDYIANM